MNLVCTKCGGTGFLNLNQIDSEIYGMDVPDSSDENSILRWIATHDKHGVQVCDCCGDGVDWYDEPGVLQQSK
jgi:hypothetical protein